MPERLQQPCPMMAGTAGFDRDHRRCKLLEECHHLLAPQLLAQNPHLGGIHPMQLKNVFRRVHPDSANLFHGRSPLSEINNDLILAHSMPPGAVHTNNFEPVPCWPERKAERGGGAARAVRADEPEAEGGCNGDTACTP